MEKNETLQEFKRRMKVPGRSNPGYTINNSWGVYDYYKYYRKNKPEGSKWVLTESQYFSIFRRVNELLTDSLIKTGELEFPFRMGKLVVMKRRNRTYIDSNGTKREKRPIDWNRTFELWYDDKEAYRDKILLYHEQDTMCFIKYNKNEAIYKNKFYYDFRPNRDLKRRALRESVVSTIINRELSEQIKGLYDG